MGTPIVVDVNVLVDAVLPSNNAAASPQSEAAYNALLMINHGDHSSLWLSDHILENTYRVLVERAGVDPELAGEYTHLLEDIAIQTGGAIVDEPPRAAYQVAAEHEDDLILDLVHHSGAPFLITSNVKDFPDLYADRAMVKKPAQFVQIYERTRIAKLAAAQHSTSRPSTKSRFDQIKARVAGSSADLIDNDDLAHYDTALEQFDQKRDRLRSIVDQWNPNSAKMAKRIELWQANLDKLQERADQAEARALLDPARATATLVDLNTRMDTAIERLNPAPPRSQRSLVEIYKTRPEPEQQALDDDREPGD